MRRRLIRFKVTEVGRIAIYLSALLLVLLPACTNANPARACDRAASHIAKETGVPLQVLRSITRTETGRAKAAGMEPWPWTVNVEGKGIWFDTREQAFAHVFRHFKSGARSFDIGCFQINYRWHGHAFNSIEEMFDPMLNARYAARFLGKLRSELGSWDRAVGAYHSKTHKYAQRYLKKYRKVRAALDPAEIDGHDNNPFPLFQNQNRPSLRGSLVPLHLSSARNILEPKSGN